MPQVANILTGLAADRLHQTHGTAGRPKFLGLHYERKHDRTIAMWDDGSLAVWGEDGEWKALNVLPDYDRLFCVTEARADD